MATAVDDITAILSNITTNRRKLRQNQDGKHEPDIGSKTLSSSSSPSPTPIFDSDSLLVMKCKDCTSTNIKEHDGYYVCQKCGLFNELIIDSGQEWRFYGADDSKGVDPSRCDMPTNELCPASGMGGLIGFGSKETRTTKRIRNMNFWNAIPYRESSLLESFNNITIMAQNSGISQCIIEEAKYMYKKVTDIKSSRRTKKEAMKAGCIMLACKLKGVPRNSSEIARMFKMKNNKTFRKSIKTFEEIWNNIQMIEKGLKPAKTLDTDEEDSDEESSEEDDCNDESPDSNTKSSVQMDSKNLQECITKLHRFSCVLGLDEKIFEACRTILIHVENEKYLDKHTPLSRTSAVIFYLNERLKLNINKYLILQTCEISEVTINKCYQKLMKFKKELEKIVLL
jgi:transcription initiation factor TFIIIB Brf1 subunit/transcription initiation factor TFIIB